MEFVTGLIIIVFGVLQIILFFKIWGMTNNVKIMTSCMQQMLDMFVRNEKLNAKTCDKNEQDNIGFAIGDLVVDKNETQWRVVEINYPIVKCKNSAKGIVEFDKDELERF